MLVNKTSICSQCGDEFEQQQVHLNADEIMELQENGDDINLGLYGDGANGLWIDESNCCSQCD